MKPASPLLVVAATCLLVGSASADPRADVLASIKALNAAPAYQIKVATADSGTKQQSAITVEVTNPDSLHMKVEANGVTQIEVYSDGKTTLSSKGGNPLKPDPLIAPMVGQIRQNSALENMVNMAKDLVEAGKDSVGGEPATIYTFDTDMMGLQGTNKLWVSDKDHRPLKSEGGTHGEMGGQKVDARTTTTYEYDPAIKVVVPAAAK